MYVCMCVCMYVYIFTYCPCHNKKDSPLFFVLNNALKTKIMHYLIGKKMDCLSYCDMDNISYVILIN